MKYRNQQKGHFVMACAMVLGGLCFANIASAKVDDPVHYWKFDEGTGRSVADPVGGENGVIFGTSSKLGWVSGKVGTALMMDGGAGTGVALPDDIVKVSGSLSVWFRMNSLSDSNVIFSARSTTEQSIYMALYIDRDGRPTMQYRDQAGGSDQRAQGTKILNKNEWYNLIIVSGQQGYRLYLNGEEVVVAGNNNGRWFSEFVNHHLSYRIGALDSSSLPGAFNGDIDDVRVYNRALTFADVKELFEIGNSAVVTMPSAIAPQLDMNISDTVISRKGSVVVRWSGLNVNICTKNGSWNGDVATSGSEVLVLIADSSTYGLSCSGKGGSVNKSVSVTVATTSALLSGNISTTPGIVSSGNAKTSVLSPQERAKILEQIESLLKLIVQLQKQLAELKAAQQVHATY